MSTLKKIRAQINDLITQFKNLESQEQTKSKPNRQQGEIKARDEINEIESKKTIPRINKSKELFLLRRQTGSTDPWPKQINEREGPG